jgi:HEAT repeat protein
MLSTGVLALSGALAGALVMLFGHGAWTRIFDRWSAPRLARARTALYKAPSARQRGVELSALRALPQKLQVRLLSELARSPEGSDRSALATLARESGLLRRAERMAHSRWWWRRLRGARQLTIFGADEILVLSLVRDPHPAVRTQAAELAASHPTPAVINALLDGLEDTAAVCRFAIQDTLLRLGPVAQPALASYLDRGNGTALAAALAVAEGMAEPAFARAAVRLCDDPEPHVRERAVALLGAIGGLDGVEAVRRRLDDAVAAVRAAAARALGQIGHWPAAPAIAALLRDRSWEVRHAAGLSLRDLGSPGLLLLRRSRADGNIFAADMARQVLDLPGAAGARP